MPTCTLWATPVCPRAGPPPCRADHSRKNGRSFMKTNHECTRIDTKTDGPPSTTSGAKMRLQFSALGVTMSWDEGFPGARASRPHQAWHSLGHLPHLDQPATAPWLSFGLADGVPADRVAACSIALKLSGGQRDRMRAGRPRSQGNHSPLEGESQKPSRQANLADAVGGGRRVTSQNQGRPVGDVSSADLPRPRLRRSPLNHNTAGGWDFPIGFPPGASPGLQLGRQHSVGGAPAPQEC